MLIITPLPNSILPDKKERTSTSSGLELDNLDSLKTPEKEPVRGIEDLMQNILWKDNTLPYVLGSEYNYNGKFRPKRKNFIRKRMWDPEDVII